MGEPWSSVRVVVFDIDDTVFLEEEYIRSGFVAVSRWLSETHGVEGFDARCWALHASGVRGDIFDRALSASGAEADPTLVASLVERYRSHAPAIALAPDARRAFEALGEQRRLAAVSDGPLVCQEAKVAALGLSAWLDPIVLTGRFPPGQGKPHPRAFRAVEGATSCRGAQLLYVADNPAKDFLAPRDLGWRTIRVRRDHGLYRALPHQPGEVDAVVENLDALTALLARH